LLLSLWYVRTVEDEVGCGPAGNKHNFKQEDGGDGICCAKCAWRILAKEAVLSAEACLKMCGPGT
jgi:DNA-directed RNA polymerase subunit RPC12/RpoP